MLMISYFTVSVWLVLRLFSDKVNIKTFVLDSCNLNKQKKSDLHAKQWFHSESNMHVMWVAYA